MSKKARQLLPLILRQWRILATIACFTVLGSAVAALQPWPLKMLVDAVVKPQPSGQLQRILSILHLADRTATLIALAAAASICAYLLSAVVSSVQTWAWSVLGQRMVHDLSTTLFHRLQRVSLTYHNRHSIGDGLNRLTGDTWCIYNLTAGLFSPGEQIFTLLTIGTLSWSLNPRLASISLAAAPVLAASTVYFGKELKARSKAAREAESYIASFVHQTLSSMPIVQAFTTEDRNSSRFGTLAENVVAVSQRRSIFTSAYGFVNGLISTAGSALMAYFGAREVMAGRLSVGSLVIFISYIRTMQGAAESLLKTYGDMKPIEASIDRVVEVLQPAADEPRDLPDARTLRVDERGPHISFDRVTFGYESDRPVLRDISFEVRPGEVVAIVGETGAGKSSLVSLIPRFYDPSAGTVRIDGEDIRTFSLASLRAQISMVLQEPFLFPITIAENIGYSKPGASREEIVRAAQLAQADAFIRRLPEGYDTPVGQYGGTLSGGEKQRIAVARAILRDAPLLILDEPTSALDARTEASLMTAFERLMEGRTCLVIAHRLSTVRRADRVIVMRQGEIVEQGTHAELLAAEGIYHRLHALQCGSYEGAAAL